MMLSLSDKAVLVTGAASGIGRAIATAVAEAGCGALMLTDKDASVAEVARDLGASHTLANLADPAAPARIVKHTLGAFGRVDALVNAAGLTTRGSVADGPIEVWDSVMAVNARAPFFLMQQVIADMLGRKAAGSIVNITSINAHCGAPDLGIYSASKGALATLTKNAANAHLADGIRVNGIQLGWVATPTEHALQTALHSPDWEAKAAQTRPLGRLLRAEEAARQALFMLSDASAPLTGVLLDLEQHVIGALP